MSNHKQIRSSLMIAFLFSSIFIALNYLFFVSLTSAANSAAVNATVTAQNVSLSVIDGVVSYGTLGTGSSQNTTYATGIGDSQAAINNGNTSEDITLRGMNSTSIGTGWTLAATAGSEQYSHKYCKTNCETSPSWIALTTNNALVFQNVSAGSTNSFNLQLGTPTSTTSFSEQAVNVTVMVSIGTS